MPPQGKCALVARRAARTLLLEAIAAIDRAVAARLEGHPRLATTAGTRGAEKLALTTWAAAATPHAALHLAGLAAVGATRGIVGEATAGKELLLTSGEDEVISAVATAERLVGTQSVYGPFLCGEWPCLSGMGYALVAPWKAFDRTGLLSLDAHHPSRGKTDFDRATVYTASGGISSTALQPVYRIFPQNSSGLRGFSLHFPQSHYTSL